MISIAFFNNKGGVGKTTLLCNLAAELALHKNKKILVIDADPQCNATQSIFDDDTVDNIYEDQSSFTVYSIVKPLSQGKGYVQEVTPKKAEKFGIDVIPGDPRLALTEDLLATDWKAAISGDIRGIRTTLLFREMLSKCQQYDFVLFDMGPSLGSINRSVLIACDYFLSPMSIDIFSLRAVENISLSIKKWKDDLEFGFQRMSENNEENNDVLVKNIHLKFVGYVTQQYTAKKDAEGKKRAVNAYERIMKKIPKVIKSEFISKLQPNFENLNYLLGTIPNLHSLIPLSQNVRKPIFELKSKDGVVGSHFTKVTEAHDIFEDIAKNLLSNICELNDPLS